jgi:hypothetical protein
MRPSVPYPADPVRLPPTRKRHGRRAVSSLTPHRVSLLVNPTRPRPGGWCVVLWASWSPSRPDAVCFELRARPAHPALPSGEWFVPEPLVVAGLERPVRHDDVSLHPDISGERVWLTVPCADRPWQAAVSRGRLGTFLDAISRCPHPSATVC